MPTLREDPTPDSVTDFGDFFNGKKLYVYCLFAAVVFTGLASSYIVVILRLDSSIDFDLIVFPWLTGAATVAVLAGVDLLLYVIYCWRRHFSLLGFWWDNWEAWLFVACTLVPGLPFYAVSLARRGLRRRPRLLRPTDSDTRLREALHLLHSPGPSDGA